MTTPPARPLAVATLSARVLPFAMPNRQARYAKAFAKQRRSEAAELRRDDDLNGLTDQGLEVALIERQQCTHLCCACASDDDGIVDTPSSNAASGRTSANLAGSPPMVLVPGAQCRNQAVWVGKEAWRHGLIQPAPLSATYIKRQLDRLGREWWNVLLGHCDEQLTFSYESYRDRKRLNLNLTVFEPNVHGGSGSKASLPPDLLGNDHSSGSVNGRLQATKHTTSHGH
jgi:hypothetical protein